MRIKRGVIYLASLDPTVGREIAKIRPVVVVSNDIGNEYAPTVTVIPVTKGNLDRIYPFEVKLSKGAGNLDADSKAKADQIRTIDKSRLVKHIGDLAPRMMVEIEQAIRRHLDL
ncbi:MAG: type II toxin-antitoxin system PemK/MazF family toxin [Desulfobacteraceae bacterium]|nr:type II toxin-antitoxin system PemK/MazF family toxin [Desulfobacteraceae bacterium]